ncbi:hypothetical protein BKA81DRAFT_234297 [Phyllosticta paracitricarpa]
MTLNIMIAGIGGCLSICLVTTAPGRESRTRPILGSSGDGERGKPHFYFFALFHFHLIFFNSFSPVASYCRQERRKTWNGSSQLPHHPRRRLQSLA